MVKFARRDLWTICEPLVQNPQCGRLDVRILNLPCQCANSWTCAILHLVLMLLFELYDTGGLLAVICHPDAWGGLSCSKKDLPQQRRRPNHNICQLSASAVYMDTDWCGLLESNQGERLVLTGMWSHLNLSTDVWRLRGSNVRGNVGCSFKPVEVTEHNSHNQL